MYVNIYIYIYVYIYIYIYIVTDLSKFVPRDLRARKLVVCMHAHALWHAHAHALFTQTLCAQRPRLLFISPPNVYMSSTWLVPGSIGGYTARWCQRAV